MKNSPKAWLEGLRHGSDEVRHGMKLLLGGLTPTDRAFVPELIEALSGDDSETRFWAATALSCIGAGAQDAVPALVELLQDQVFGNRQAAAHAVVRVGPAADSAVPALLQWLKDDRNEYVRQEIVRALGGIGTPVAVTALVEILRDPDVVLRQHAVISLKLLAPRAQASIPALRELMSREKDEGIRTQVVAALRIMGEGGDGRR